MKQDNKIYILHISKGYIVCYSTIWNIFLTEPMMDYAKVVDIAWQCANSIGSKQNHIDIIKG